MGDVLQSVTFSVDEAAIRAYADITDDYNPIHVDPAFAAQTEMKGVIAHGTMSLSLIWQSVAATFGMDAAANSALEVRFNRPVRPGDMLTAGGKRTDSASERFEVWVANQHDERVIEGTFELGAMGETTK